jgi:hypothetical protein
MLVACGAPPSGEAVANDAGEAHDVAALPVGDASTGPKASNLPECGAQRIVHISAGNGGLAWFTQVWPVPAVIASFDPSDAYDDPAKAPSAPGATPQHPLYAREIAGRVVTMTGTGTHPMPTAFVAGPNETHTLTPNLTQVGGVDVVAVAAAVQTTALHPAQTVIALRPPVAYVAQNGQPAPLVAEDSSAAIAALAQANVVSSATAQDLAPSDATVATWFDATNAPNDLLALAEDLAFAANAFRDNVASTILVGALRDDPHGAFDDSSVTYHADALASILHHFYAALAANDEPACSHDGHVLSLADNVVLVVTGDTPKDPFNRYGWPDGTPGASNIVYVRSNGWLTPGWFGDLAAPYSWKGFDPASGAPSVGATLAADQSAEALGLLYAITRGNAALVAVVSSAPYQAAVASSSP